ncbi:class I mannose-6-phosphate isomerase [Qipengyuania sp. ASV99]|uniref:class I mannose-6-phosphate isomerase n=1 Tax=Qipengyuania sp. ASV99 TaxID=3399681 RepID=UPI003A4C78C1
MIEKVWGRTALPAPFTAPAGKKIGEIWFEPPPELPQVLVKYLFTSEKLSVQVHPSDADALPGEAGKEECWLVLDAQPGAQLAIGFNRQVSPEQIAAAARDGSIEALLSWHNAQVGDVFFLPAGTVHAIGPGLALVEVQQSSDTTFRLYDYGRPRELHLERALAVAKGVPYPVCHRSSVAARGQTLINADHFRLDRIEGAPDADVSATYFGALLALPLSGEVRARSVQARAGPGECLFAESIEALDFTDAGVTLLTRAK